MILLDEESRETYGHAQDCGCADCASNGVGEAGEAAPTLARTDEGIADFLRSEYWGGRERQFDPGSDNAISVNITALTTGGQKLARAALESWSDVTGVSFVETSGGADINFDDNQSGAFAGSSYRSDGTIVSSSVNISTDWINRYGTDYDSYSYQTYIHEIGHALGLGHAGSYNGSANYSEDAAYLNDSWQATVMSYFSQTQNDFIDATFAYILTPMSADVVAVQEMYGVSASTRTGNTTYGFSPNHGEERLDFVEFNRPVALTIVDSGGLDTLNLSGYTADQVISLEAGTISSYGGGRGNLIIGRDTEIERGFGGSGDDVIIAGSHRNVMRGNGGEDEFTFGGDIGRNLILDFELGVDSIVLTEGMSFDDFVVRQRNKGTMLRDGDNSIFLVGVDADDLLAEDPFILA